MMTKFKGLAAGLIVGFLGMFLIGMMVTRNMALEGTYTYLKLFNEVLSLIRNSYVDEVHTNSLMKGAYQGMLTGVDSFSEFLSADEYKRYQAFTATRTDGVNDSDAGIRVARKSGILVVVSVKPGSEAETVGITPGDRVQKIAGRSTRLMNLFEAESLLAGAPDTKVSVVVLRREDPRKIETELTCRRVEFPDPDLQLIEGKGGMAVLRIAHFGKGVSSHVAEQLERARKAGVGRLLIDLRGNAWGAIPEAVETAGLFIGDSVVARLENKTGTVRDLRPKQSGKSYSGITEVLIDRSTAEAAELFTAALEASGVSVVGETSFGVGAEQDLLPLDNGGYLKLSVMKYVSPSGLSWHGKGLEPSTRIVIGQENMSRADRMEKQLEDAIGHLESLGLSAHESKAAAAEFSGSWSRSPVWEG